MAMVAATASLGCNDPWGRLRLLDLSRNKLTELPPHVLEALPLTLEVLDVSRNQLRELPDALRTLPRLTEANPKP
jgi:Leucine-rich repeat (LRR) protein